MHKMKDCTQPYSLKFPDTAGVPRCIRLPYIILAAGGALMLTPLASGTSFQPPAGRTGAPPENVTCAECHLSQGGGSLTVEFSGNAFTYVPNGLYDLNIILQDGPQQRFGFSATSRQASSPTQNVGSWVAGADSAVYDSGRHIGHRNAPFHSGGHTFEVSWMAPSSNVGDIVFYVAGNAANGNGINGVGDNIYTRMITIRPASSLSFWAEAPRMEGWRYTGQASPGLAGIGWIFDDYWPWIITTGQGASGVAEWVWVSEDGSANGFWGYNASRNFWFWGDAVNGWYYSYEGDNTGWKPYNL